MDGHPAGREKGAKCPTSEAFISIGFHYPRARAPPGQPAPEEFWDEVFGLAKSTDLQPFVRVVVDYADNCTGTNKSKFAKGAYGTFLVTGLLDAYYCSYQVVGHTKFASDVLAQLVANSYNKSDCYNLGQLNKFAGQYSNTQSYDGSTLKGYKPASESLFASVNNITQYRSFVLVADDGLLDDPDFQPVARAGLDLSAYPKEPGPIYTADALDQAIEKLKERSLVAVINACLEETYSGIGSATGLYGPPSDEPLFEKRRVVRMFKRPSESCEFWIEQLNYHKQNARSKETIDASLAKIKAFNELSAEEVEALSLKAYYGQKEKHIIEQYERYVPPEYVPDEYILGSGGMSGELSEAMRSQIYYSRGAGAGLDRRPNFEAGPSTSMRPMRGRVAFARRTLRDARARSRGRAEDARAAQVRRRRPHPVGRGARRRRRRRRRRALGQLLRRLPRLPRERRVPVLHARGRRRFKSRKPPHLRGRRRRRRENANWVTWFENDGAQSFAERVLVTAFSYVWTVAAADVDGDGDLDVVVGVGGADTVSWHENDGSQSFTEHIISTLVNNALTVDPLDVDGDGDVDVLSGSHNDANIVLWENDCGTSAPSAAPSGSPAPTKTPDPTTSPAPTPRAAAR